MNYHRLLDSIVRMQSQAQSSAALAVNRMLSMRNWVIGAYIVEFEQNGEDRATYGSRLLDTIAADLKGRGAKGLSARNLKNFRQVALAYPAVSIRQTVSAEFGGSGPDAIDPFPSITARSSLQPALEWQTSEYYARLFAELTWSHLLELARLDDPLRRAFYELEAIRGGWSLRELKRQLGSMLYERTGLSRDKDAVRALASEGRIVESPEAMLRDPYVLEFLGLHERAIYSENDLEQALVEHLREFLLELGRDFCFVAQQFRITVGNRHHHLDLLFYHRMLRCLVAVDLKLGEFTHGDAGQMNFYLNWLRENEALPDENPPVGILLCADKESETVRYATAGLDQKLFVSRYLVALPSEERLREWLHSESTRLDHIRGVEVGSGRTEVEQRK